MNTDNQEAQPYTVITPQDDYAYLQRYEIQNLWHMRWFFAIIVALGFLASVAAGIIAFLITRNSYTLLIIPAPTIFLRVVASYLLPMDNRRFRLAAIKVRAKIQDTNSENLINVVL